MPSLSSPRRREKIISNGGGIPIAVRPSADVPSSWEQPVVCRSSSVDAASFDGIAYVSLPAPAWIEKSHFETRSTPTIAMPRIIAAVRDVGGEIEMVKPQKSKVKCSIFHQFSLVKFHITMYRSKAEKASTNIIEFQRRQGDSFSFNTVHSLLLEALQDLSTTPLTITRA